LLDRFMTRRRAGPLRSPLRKGSRAAIRWLPSHWPGKMNEDTIYRAALRVRRAHRPGSGAASFHRRRMASSTGCESSSAMAAALIQTSLLNSRKTAEQRRGVRFGRAAGSRPIAFSREERAPAARGLRFVAVRRSRTPSPRRWPLRGRGPIRVRLLSGRSRTRKPAIAPVPRTTPRNSLCALGQQRQRRRTRVVACAAGSPLRDALGNEASTFIAEAADLDMALELFRPSKQDRRGKQSKIRAFLLLKTSRSGARGLTR
jgi:hypothetical protein